MGGIWMCDEDGAQTILESGLGKYTIPKPLAQITKEDVMKALSPEALQEKWAGHGHAHDEHGNCMGHDHDHDDHGHKEHGHKEHGHKEHGHGHDDHGRKEHGRKEHCHDDHGLKDHGCYFN